MMSQRIYISSDYDDMNAYRLAAHDAAIACGWIPVLVNLDTSPAARREQLENCDLFMGIYAHSYGIRPAGSDTSILEMEFDWAAASGMRRLCLILDETHPWPHTKAESGYSHLQFFKQDKLIKSRLLSLFKFTTPASLECAIARELLQHQDFRHRIQCDDHQFFLDNLSQPVPDRNNSALAKITLIFSSKVTDPPGLVRDLSKQFSLSSVEVLHHTDNVMQMRLPVEIAWQLFEASHPQLDNDEANTGPPTLTDIQNHKDDYMWLSARLDVIYHEIERAFQADHSITEAIAMTLAMMPHVLPRADYSRWERLLFEALHHAMNLQDNEFLIQVWTYLGEADLQRGFYRSASQAFKTAFDRAKDNAEPDRVLLARIGLLRTNGIYHTDDIDTFIAETLQLARVLDNPALQANLYRALATAYLHHGSLAQALEAGQMAYVYWHRVNNRFEKNRAALLLAEVCRVGQRFAQARRYLEFVRDHIEHNHDEVLHAYQRGAILLEMGQLAEAKHWLEHALERCQNLDSPYLLAAAHHTLALAEIQLKNHAAAYNHLRHALIIWQKVDNHYQQAEGLFALGYWHETQAEFGEALELYEEAMKTAETPGKTPMIDDLLLRIQTAINRITHHIDHD